LFVTHYTGRPAGVAAAITATVLWLIAETLPPATYSSFLVPAWNACMRLGVLLVIVLLVSAMRTLNKTLEQRVRERSAELEQETRERRELERRILEISEREQARIGQDLHDGLCQHLVGTAFTAGMLRKKLAERNVPEVGEATQIVDLLDESITQARQLARGLYPVRLEESGLATALLELAGTMQARFNLLCEFQLINEGEPPGETAAIHLYRIAQEAVNNAIQHAHASRIVLTLKYAARAFELRVEDNGIGVGRAGQEPGGMGLRIMEYRARMIGSTLSARSRPGGGTLVVCSSLPVNSTAIAAT